jgi:hypothetical protein
MLLDLKYEDLLAKQPQFPAASLTREKKMKKNLQKKLKKIPAAASLTRAAAFYYCILLLLLYPLLHFTTAALPASEATSVPSSLSDPRRRFLLLHFTTAALPTTAFYYR